MRKISGIYVIFNKITNNFYIGSSVDIIKRFSGHLKVLKSNRHENKYLQRAFNKYREDQFQFTLIQAVRYRENLIDREQYWIDYYEAHADYNILTEADSRLGTPHGVYSRMKMSKSRKGMKAWNKGKSPSAETRKKISRTLKKRGYIPWIVGKHHTEESRIKMSIAHIGKPSNRKGHITPPDVRKKQSEAHKGKHLTDEAKRKIGEAHRLRYKDPKNREHQSRVLKEVYKDVELRKRIGEAVKESLKEPEIRKKMGIASKLRWQNPEYKKNFIEKMTGRKRSKLRRSN